MSSRSLLLVLLVLACLQSFMADGECMALRPTERDLEANQESSKNVRLPSHCCFNFQKTPVPEKFVISYKKTLADCTKPGVILYLTKDRLVCVNPAEVWVQNIMKNIAQHQEASERQARSMITRRSDCIKTIIIIITSTSAVMFSRCVLLGLLVLACLQCFTTAQSANTPSSCCFRFQTQPVPIRHIAAYAVTELQCTKSGIIFTLKDGQLVCADPDKMWVKNLKKRIDDRLSKSQ
ncbi:uncharacterized protein LOC131356312 [Hemibagrus wyckioides]|uniref:uncharacterized protein LOC131356312 n=1 Tax=Hemibagrus wyckioides TaxID=337641 RepID=UPI00266BF960|nr:uncharacterized protein LOC131356312 [Hemibagrus wyckioides]